jgi:hypothetical protein
LALSIKSAPEEVTDNMAAKKPAKKAAKKATKKPAKGKK